MTISLRVPTCTAVSSAKAEILDVVSSSVMCPVKSGLQMIDMLNRSATTTKISGESGQPCLVPELMWQALSESLPLTLILALTWSFLYTVCTRDRNLAGHLFLKYLVDGCEAHHIEGLLLVQENDRPFLILGVDEVDEELNIDNVLPTFLRWNESALVVSYPFCKDRPHPVGPNSHNYLVVVVEEGDGSEFVHGV